jgi:hypothetical protein
MAQFHYLTPMERQRLERARAENPNLPLTEKERSILRQAEAEGATKVAADAKARQAAREAAVPDHEKRPVNHARRVLEMRLEQDRPGNRQSPTILESLRKRADEEDARIDALMAEKKRQYLLANDPDVQNAVKHAEGALKLAADEDREARAKALGIAKEGDWRAYWKAVQELNTAVVERQKANQIDAATARSAAEAEYLKRKEETDKAVAELRESMAQLQKSLSAPIE